MKCIAFVYAFMLASGCCSVSGWSFSSSKFKEVVYLETHVYADNGYLKYYHGDKRSATKYIVKFWNSVELRFSNIIVPLRLPLVSVTFLNESDDQNVFGNENNMANVTSSILNFKNLLKSRGHTATSDLVYMLTSRSLYWTPHRTHAAGGSLIDNGFCTENNIAMGIDKPGKYTGYLWAVRHLAKVIGARDDGRNGNECHASGGYLMANTDKGYTFNQFSSCSEEDIKRSLFRINPRRSPSCLARNFSLRDVRQDFLNETLGVAAESLSLRSRCQAYFGEDKWSCRERYTSCGTTCCTQGGWYDVTWPAIGYLPTADGQSCYDDKSRCFNGICLDLPGYSKSREESDRKLREWLKADAELQNQQKTVQ
ncbi:uncharacterized protein LOC135383925 [Ornithodoros turicata]|uniref:uncharacterized protein LOC135383925 n=1 Tax=Ornithodoros turicata TaxID=34597 RepID=UPI0031396985